MSDGIWWRKIKRNVIRDDTMRMIAEELDDDSLRPLVLNFYIIAYMLADDDGVFDFGNGKVFRRLMYAPSLSDVLTIRNALCENGVISAVFDHAKSPVDTLYIINDWRDVNESPYKERPARTADERRAAVASRIAEDKGAEFAARNITAARQREISAAQKNRTTGVPPAPLVRVDFDAMQPALDASVAAPAPQADAEATAYDVMQRAAFAAAPVRAQNDKNAESVVNNFFDDKNAKNVVNTQDRTVQDSTGQDRFVHAAAEPPSAQTQQDSTATARSSAPAAAQDSRGQRKTPSGQAVSGSRRSSGAARAPTGAAVAAPVGEVGKEDTPVFQYGVVSSNDEQKRVLASKRSGVFGILSAFFIKNGKPCHGMAESTAENRAFLLLCDLCLAMSDKKNIPQVVAAMLVGQVKKLYNDEPVAARDIAEPSILLYLAEELRRLLGVPDELFRAAIGEYNARLENVVQSQPAPRETVQSLAEQAISEDTG